jgi:hypothetical protein
MKMPAALAQLSSGKGEEMAEDGVRNWGARGSPFIGARGGEGGERWRAPASFPRWGWWRTVAASGRRDGSGRRKAPNRAGERDNGEAMGRARERERGRVWAGNGPAEGGCFPFSFSIFYFLFLFLISISFISFSFDQIIS